MCSLRVDDAAEEGHDQHAAVGDIAFELGGGFVVHHVEIGDEQHLVSPEVRVGEHKVHRDVLRVQRPVILLHLLEKLDVGRRLGILFERPPALPVDEDAGAGFDGALGDHAELLELVAQCRDLAPDARVLDAYVRHERAVELLGPSPGRTPLEEHDGARPACDRLQAPKSHLAGLLEGIARAPVDLRRHLLHQHPRRAVAQRAGEIVLGGRDARRPGIVRVRVGVERDDVLLRRPGPVVERFEEAHEVGGHGHLGRDALQDLPLHLVQFEDGVGREAPPVELLGRVGKRRCTARRVDLLPVVVALAPEGRTPRRVERVERAVTPAQPLAERRGRLVAEALVDVAAVLVVDMPDRQGGMVAVAFGKTGDQLGRGLAVGAGMRTVRLPPAGPERYAVGRHRQALGVPVRQPGRRRSRGRCETGLDAVLVQQVKHPVEPAKIVVPGTRFEPGPREDANRDQVDACRLHEAHVLQPDLLGPLLRVVVAAVPDARVLQKCVGC